MQKAHIEIIRHRRGRPRRTASVASEFISLRVTPPEKQTIARAATRASKPVHTWSRDALLAAANSPEPRLGLDPAYALDPGKVGKLSAKEKSEMTK